MKRNIPQVVVEANAFINGKGYLGIVKNLKVPTIEFETIETKGALGATYQTGALKDTQVEFKISKIDKNQFVSLGLNAFSSRIPFLFKAGFFEGSGKQKSFSMALTGDILSYEISDFEDNKEIEVTYKVSAHFLDINIDGVPMVLKDVENMICVIGGVDYMAKLRDALSE